MDRPGWLLVALFDAVSPGMRRGSFSIILEQSCFNAAASWHDAVSISEVLLHCNFLCFSTVVEVTNLVNGVSGISKSVIFYYAKPFLFQCVSHKMLQNQCSDAQASGEAAEVLTNGILGLFSRESIRIFTVSQKAA